jgi:alkanesulfonate monooxygenase SsuD/methylene tetrahydromethanopterin reductase-like flavin-dependent oxidoreductase (luciferase family)
MRFDLACELALPPLPARGERRLLADTLEEIECADRLGFGAVWLAERHLSRSRPLAAAPDLVLAAAAQRTRRIGLGVGPVALALHPPVQLAERIAALDQLSGGRVELAVGRGALPAEFAAFGVRAEDRHALNDEALAVLRASFTGAAVSFQGRQVRLDQAEILPRVLQQPHPPLWCAAATRAGFEWAVRERLGLQLGGYKPWFMVEQDLAVFRDLWATKWTGHDRPRIALTVGLLCLPDAGQARALARPAFAWHYGELLREAKPLLQRLYPDYRQAPPTARVERLLRGRVRASVAELGGLAIAGSPAQVRERIARLRAAGVTHLQVLAGCGAVESAVVRDCLACLAAEVMPAFA